MITNEVVIEMKAEKGMMAMKATKTAMAMKATKTAKAAMKAVTDWNIYAPHKPALAASPVIIIFNF